MAYVRQTWVDGASGNTPLSAGRLNHLEAGVEAAASVADEAAADAGAAYPAAGGTVTGPVSVDEVGQGDVTIPYGLGSAPNTGIAVRSSFAGGEDDGVGTDSTGRINLYSYQRASNGSFGEIIRMYAMRGNAKLMQAWWFPDGGYDGSLNPVGNFKPVVWTGAHWQANDGASNHKHWSVETPDPSGAIQTRFEVRFGDPSVDDAIAGLDKTIVATNLADFVVRCSNGQVLRLSGPAGGSNKPIEWNHDYAGSDQYRRWQLRATNEAESGGDSGTNLQLARYADDGTLIDTPIVVSRATGNVTLGPGLVARRSTASVSSLTLNTTSLGGGQGVIGIGNANAAPTLNPSGGGVLFAEDGALKWRGSSGTVTTIAPA